MKITYRLAGIPCLIEAERITGTSGAYLDDDHYTAEPDYYDWRILDRRGRPAAWLERKITPDIERDIERSIEEVAP